LLGELLTLLEVVDHMRNTGDAQGGPKGFLIFFKEILTSSHLRVKCTCVYTCTDTRGVSLTLVFPYFLVILFLRDRDAESPTSA